MAIFAIPNFIPVLLGKIVRKRLEQPYLAIPNLYQSFWETLLEKDWNKHFWPFLIYTSLSGKNCWKKFGTTIFGHSKFIPVFLGNIVRKRLEQTFLAIPNLYQSFWEKLLEKIWNNHFWPFQIYTSPFWEKLLGKIQNGHFWPFQICTSLLEKNCWKIIWNGHFFHSKFIPVLLGKIVRKRLEQAFFTIPDLYQFFWEKFSEKNWNNHFWPFLIYTSLLEKNCWKKIQNGHYWPFQIYTSLSGKHCQKKIGTNIFGHS